MHENAKKTSGGLTKSQLKYNKQGKIVSKKASALAKKNNRLVKAGYVTRKGQFGVSMKGGGGNREGIELPELHEYPVLNNIAVKASIKKYYMVKSMFNRFNRFTRHEYKNAISSKNNYSDIISLLKEDSDMTPLYKGGLLQLACNGRVYIDFPDAIVELLLDKGANPNVLTANNSSLLHLACCIPSIEKVRLLLYYGANPNILDTDKQSPLYLANNIGITLGEIGDTTTRDDIVRLLLDKGAVLGCYDKKIRNSLSERFRRTTSGAESRKCIGKDNELVTYKEFRKTNPLRRYDQ